MGINQILELIKDRKSSFIIPFIIIFFFQYFDKQAFYILPIILLVIIVVGLLIIFKIGSNFSILNKNYLFEYKKVRRVIHEVFNFFSYNLRDKEYEYSINLIIIFFFYAIIPALSFYFFYFFDSIKKFVYDFSPYLFQFVVLLFLIISTFSLFVFTGLPKEIKFIIPVFIILIILFSFCFAGSLYSLVSSYTTSNTSSNTSYFSFSNSSKSSINKELEFLVLYLILYLIFIYFLVSYLIIEAIKSNFFIYLSNLIREEINKKLVENKDKLPIFSLLVDDKIIEGKIVKINPEECEFEIETKNNEKHIIPWNRIKESFSIKHTDS